MTASDFAMTDPKKIMEKLSMLLRKNKLYSEFILIKFAREGVPEIIESYQTDRERFDDIVKRIKFWNETYTNTISKEVYNEIFYMESGGNKYEVISIGEATYVSGVLVRKISEIFKDEKDFYLYLIKSVFNNLDTYSQVERFVAVEEQNRIANEIHDTVIQKLFGITCSLAVLENKVKMAEKNMEKNEIIDSIHM